ncbi:MAG TPA: flagellar biosynthesis protein [Bacillota bacterium]
MGAGETFRRAFEQRLGPALRWSRHAEQRLRSSGVRLDGGAIARIERAVSELADRGARESLVVYGDLALIVSVPSRTVVTAATPERLADGIFTQIDSAALIRAASDPGAGPAAAGDAAGEAPRPRNDGSGPDPRRMILP